MWKKIAMFACGATLFCATMIPAMADPPDFRTVVTFSQPVDISGTTLPAGTYVFKLFDSRLNRNIVQVFDQRETHLYATIIGMPDSRFVPTGKTVMQLDENQAANPNIVRSWFYPGEVDGVQFYAAPADTGAVPTE